MSDTLFGWVVVGLSLIAAWGSVATGRVRFNDHWYVWRRRKPVIFWLAVWAPVLIGLVIVVHGLH